MKQLKANGQVFEVGCVWASRSEGYRRVLDVIDIRIICADSFENADEAEETQFGSYSFTKEDLEDSNAKVIRYKICGKDKNGEVVRAHDKIKDYSDDEYEVLDEIESFSGDNRDYFIVKDNKVWGGWSFSESEDYTLSKRWGEEKKEQERLYPVEICENHTILISKEAIEKIKKMEL